MADEAAGAELAQPAKPALQVSVRTLWYAMPPFLLGVGLLFLWGYWGTFDVNVLEYLALTDVVKVAAYPILAYGAVTLYSLVAMLWFDVHDVRRKEGGRLAVSKLFKWTMGSATVGASVYLIAKGDSERWLSVALTLGLLVSMAAIESKRLWDRIEPTWFSILTVIVVCMLPAIAFGLGKSNAERILMGTSFHYLVESRESLPVRVNGDAKVQPRHLGYAGDHHFFLDPLTQTLVIVKDVGGPLRLRLHKDHESPGLDRWKVGD